MFCSSSSVTLVVVVSRLRSMTGVAAVTLTVSAVPATPSFAAIGVDAPLTTCTVSLAKGLKPWQRRLDGVGADRQVQEVRLALRVGHLRLGERTGEIDADAGQPAAGRILDRDVDAPGEHLRRRRRGAADRDDGAPPATW